MCSTLSITKIKAVEITVIQDCHDIQYMFFTSISKLSTTTVYIFFKCLMNVFACLNMSVPLYMKLCL